MRVEWSATCTISQLAGLTSCPVNFNFERDLNMKNLLVRLWKEEEGQDLTEYALLLVLISLVAVASMQTVGRAVSDVFANATTSLTT